jgi:hypothetical protein
MIAGISGGLSQMSGNLQPDPYTASLSISRLQGRDVDTSTLIWECCQSTGGEGASRGSSSWKRRVAVAVFLFAGTVAIKRQGICRIVGLV